MASMPVINRGGETVINSEKTLTVDTMFQNLRKMEYAVRGAVVIEADRIAEELKSGSSEGKEYPFDHIVYTNIGNPQSVGQKPLTWPRQVLALVDLSEEDGVDHPDAAKLFPSDAIARAKEIKANLACGSTGAYSHSKGVKCFREDVAAFIEKRDHGVPADPESIFLTNGASAAISMILNTLIADETCGVMIPIPQYPIYSASIDLLGGQKVGYYLDETKNWDLNMEELERSLKEARAKGIKVNSFVLINPGNPTGQVLSKESVHDIVRFCAKNKLVLLADEVYQENVYFDDQEFVSCKLAAHETGLLDEDAIEMVSFHSTSKGVYGECGRRGGYMELVGIDAGVADQLYKLASSTLCSTLAGQVMVSVMVRGPAEGDVSYESYETEKRTIYDSLKKRSKIVSSGLDTIDGFSCQPSQGSMYCFPSVEMPENAIKEAQEKGVAVDGMYAISLLRSTGICVVPASGFGQRDGRYGFRTTFLPSEEEMERCIGLFRSHHEDFCKRYA